MRLTAKLKINLNRIEIPAEGMELENYLKPVHFLNQVTVAAYQCALQDNDQEEEFGAPSNAIKLGYDIKPVASIALADSLLKRDMEKRRDLKDFLKLMDLKWSSKLARVCLINRQYNKRTPLPLPEDMESLAKYLKKELQELDTNDKSMSNYIHAVQLVQARLVTYNRRRDGELQALTLTDYVDRTKGMSSISEHLIGELTELEKKLIESQDVVEIRGKTGRGVPVIIPPYAGRILEYIINEDVRMEAGVSTL